MKNSAAKRTAYYGMFVALAFVFSYIEVLIPFSIGIYGFKLGLANIIVLTALYALSLKDAFFISCIRIFLVGLTFGNMFSLAYSLAGGVLSLIIMWALIRTKKFSIIGVSVAGGIAHNIGQIIVAILLLDTVSLAYYLPLLLVFGTITGVLVGLLGSAILKIQKKIFRI